MNPDTSAVDPVLNLIPEGWRGAVIAFFVFMPIFGRAYHAIVNGGGLKGIYRALMFGTNADKLLIAGLCLLTLAACTTQQRADAAGRAQFIALQIAEASGKAAAQTALDAAESELKRLETTPLPPEAGALGEMARSAAISKAADLVVQARVKVAQYHVITPSGK